MCNREAYRANRKQWQILDMNARTQSLNSPKSSHLILHCGDLSLGSKNDRPPTFSI